jgi:hypothetical protein
LILPPYFPFWQCPYHGDISVRRYGLCQAILPYNTHSGLLADRMKTGNAFCVPQGWLSPNVAHFSISGPKDR